MPNFLRLRHSNAPEPNRNSEAIYADAAGVLKQVAPDGSETELGGGGGGGSQPDGVLALRRSVMFDHADIGYDAGGGFALFDTGLTLAAGEEVVMWYRHVPVLFTSATGVATDFSIAAYAGPTGEGDALNGGTNDGVNDSVGSQLSQVAAVSGIGNSVSGATVDVDTPVFGYIFGPNESLITGKVQFVLIVAAAAS